MSIKFEMVTDGDKGRLVKASMSGCPCVAGLGSTQEQALRNLQKRIESIRYDFDRNRMALPQDADREYASPCQSETS